MDVYMSTLYNFILYSSILNGVINEPLKHLSNVSLDYHNEIIIGGAGAYRQPTAPQKQKLCVEYVLITIPHRPYDLRAIKAANTLFLEFLDFTFNNMI